MQTYYRAKKPVAVYDGSRVERLKQTLRRALRHASNVRHVGPAERIIAVAIESSEQVNLLTDTSTQATGYFLSRYSGPPNMITVQSTKDAVDALAKKQTDSASFEANVGTVSYKLPALRRQNDSDTPR
jgi:hypothetical protein